MKFQLFKLVQDVICHLQRGNVKFVQDSRERQNFFNNKVEKLLQEQLVLIYFDTTAVYCLRYYFYYYYYRKKNTILSVLQFSAKIQTGEFTYIVQI